MRSLKARLAKAEQKIGVKQTQFRLMEFGMTAEEKQAQMAEDPEAVWIIWDVPEEIQAEQEKERAALYGEPD